MNAIKKTTLSLALVLVSCIVYSQEYKPSFKVSKGQEYNYLMDMTMDMTQSMGGQEMKYGMSSKATVKNTISEVMPDGKIEIITSNWDASVTSKIMKDTTMTYKGKVGPSTKFILDKFGNILSRTKLEADSSENKIPGLDNMSNSTIFCEFPEKPISPGDKWIKEHTDSVPSPVGKLEFKIKSEYTLGSKETIEGKSLYKLLCTSNIQISGKGNMQGMDIAMDGTGIKTDDIYFDPSTGTIFSDKANMELDINVAITGQQNMTIPMNQKVAINFKLIK
ncbi:MAG TPA: hypothetical protein VIH57_19120 [Bacteroidales bacterium]